MGRPTSAGTSTLCGPTWPVPDVEAALVGGFEAGMGLPKAEAVAYLEKLREEGRHVLEVYYTNAGSRAGDYRFARVDYTCLRGVYNYVVHGI